jgi:hypothetical protein
MKRFHKCNSVGLTTFQEDLDYFLKQEQTQEVYKSGDSDQALYDMWCVWIASDGQAGYPIVERL